MLSRKIENDFITLVGHDIRSLLTSIKAYSQLMRRQTNAKEDAKNILYLSKMDLQLDNLSSIVVDLLELMNIRNRERVLTEGEINFRELLNKTISSTVGGESGYVYKVKISSKNKPRLPTHIVERIFANLVLAIRKNNSNKHAISISVHIDDDSIKSIFGVGKRTKNDKKNKNMLNSNNIYLAIAAEFLKIINGEIDAEYSYGELTRVTIKLQR